MKKKLNEAFIFFQKPKFCSFKSDHQFNLRDFKTQFICILNFQLILLNSLNTLKLFSKLTFHKMIHLVHAISATLKK